MRIRSIDWKTMGLALPLVLLGILTIGLILLRIVADVALVVSYPGVLLLLPIAAVPLAIGLIALRSLLSRPDREPVASAETRNLEDTATELVRVGRQVYLEDVDILKGLPAGALAQLLARGRFLQVPQGTALAKQGHKGTTLYFILEGQVQLTTHSHLGEMTVRIAGPGESLPLAVLLRTGTLLTNAYAMSHLTVMAISVPTLIEVFQTCPEIGMHVYRAVADILGNRYGRTLGRLSETAEDCSRHAEAFANV